jgi:hypothetical protein
VLGVVPLAVTAFAPLKGLFEPLPAKHSEYSGPKIFVLQRKAFVPPITIRYAV